jgi:hypothetical protein
MTQAASNARVRGRHWVMFGTPWRIARFAGIDIRVDSSWIVIAVALAIAPFVVLVQTVGWVIGQHSFPDGGTWLVAGVGVVLLVLNNGGQCHPVE